MDDGTSAVLNDEISQSHLDNDTASDRHCWIRGLDRLPRMERFGDTRRAQHGCARGGQKDGAANLGKHLCGQRRGGQGDTEGNSGSSTESAPTRGGANVRPPCGHLSALQERPIADHLEASVEWAVGRSGTWLDQPAIPRLWNDRRRPHDGWSWRICRHESGSRSEKRVTEFLRKGPFVRHSRLPTLRPNARSA